jgi:erythronate-4-phosphate dehydrogenase
MINVLADQYLYKIKSYLPKSINLTLFDPVKGFPKNLNEAHGLLIRTVIPFNKQTVPNIPSQLEFVGTASAGTDHVDNIYLQKHGITFANAAGCNARSVAEYVATALLLWSEYQKINLQKLSVGIVGVGNVGTQIKKILSKLDISTVLYDPPRSRREPHFTTASLDTLLNCDILSFHTPLTRTGDHATHHWLDEEKLSTRRFQLIINSARGGVIDESALLKATANGTVQDIIIDTWEDEPQLNLDTAEQAFIKTPHIAGYSVQAKENASRIAANALLDYFDIPKPEQEDQQNHRIMEEDISRFDSLYELLTELHPIKKYESELQKIITEHPGKRGQLFNELRANYPLRQEFSQTFLPVSYFDRFPILKYLGFSEIPTELR